MFFSACHRNSIDPTNIHRFHCSDSHSLIPSIHSHFIYFQKIAANIHEINPFAPFILSFLSSCSVRCGNFLAIKLQDRILALGGITTIWPINNNSNLFSLHRVVFFTSFLSFPFITHVNVIQNLPTKYCNYTP